MSESHGSYAPQSPDLTALHNPSFASIPQDPNALYSPTEQPSHDYPFAPLSQPAHPYAPYPQPSYASYDAPLDAATQPYHPKTEHGDNAPWPPPMAPHTAWPMQPQPQHQQPPPPAPKPEPLKPYPGELENIVVKTKFPVARIKRIVQADEDVGKVAQATPHAVGKALELFMVSLALRAAAEAKSRGSRRVTAGHMKAAVAKDEQFDFLEGVVGRIPDLGAAATGKASKKRESSEEPDAMDDDDEDGSYGAGKGKRKKPAAAQAGRRRKKATGGE